MDYTLKREPGYKALIADVKKVFKVDYRQRLDETLLLDFLILNADRHLGNLGLIVRNKGVVKPAPIFDSGMSLFCNKCTTEIQWGADLASVVKSRPFYWKCEEQFNYIDKSKIPVTTNITQTLKYVKGLTAHKLPKEKVTFISEMLAARIKLI